jgi:cytochrome P450
MTSTAVRRFPFPEQPGPRCPDEYARLTAAPGLPTGLLAGGVEALLVTRYAEVRAVLSDDRFSRAEFAGRPMFARTPESLALVTSDPPVHTRRRRAVLPAFTARRARELTPWLRELAGELVDRLITLPQPVDLVESFTVPFTLRAITMLLGIPPSDEDRLRQLVDAMMSTTRFTAERVASAHEEAGRYFSDLLALRESEIAAGAPGPDLITELLTAPEPDRLSRKEITVMGAGLLMAGYETTSNQLAMCALMVFGDPVWAQRLRADPAALPLAIEEMLRWSSLIATGGAPHVALEDVWLGDTLVRAGQVVLPLIDAANRDAAAFSDPERFTPSRDTNPHLAFGHGRHLCLGAPLARVELHIGLTALLRLPRLEIAVPTDQLRWRTGMFIRGLVELPVRCPVPR